MRHVSLLSGLALGTAVAAGASMVEYASSTTDLLAELPPCAISCLTEAFQVTTCSPTNTTCTCTDPSYNTNATACVTTTCSFRDSLTTKNITETICGYTPQTHGRALNIWTGIGFMIASWIFLVIRLVVRPIAGLPYGWDDYLAMLAAANLTVTTVLQYEKTYLNGYGLDVWTIPFEMLIEFVKWHWISTFLYLLQTGFIRLMYLLFFQRIFPNTKSQLVIWITVCITAAFGVCFPLIVIFQCWPIPYTWLQYTGTYEGRCTTDAEAVGYAHAIVSIILDVWILAIPIFHIYRLNIGTAKKIGVCIMFGLGGVATIIGIIRIRTIAGYTTTMLNPTVELMPITLYSVLEPGIATIGACLPSMLILFNIIFKPKTQPRIPEAERSASSYGSGGKRSETSGGKESDNGLRRYMSPMWLTSKGARGLLTLTRLTQTRATQRDVDETELVEPEIITESVGSKARGSRETLEAV